MKSTRENMEELNIRGPFGQQDTRIINSYPSKVLFAHRQKSTVRTQSKVKSLCMFVSSHTTHEIFHHFIDLIIEIISKLLQSLLCNVIHMSRQHTLPTVHYYTFMLITSNIQL